MIERQKAKYLLSQSLKELACTKSIDKITVKEITDNCGFSSRTFYNNFKSISELILWSYQEKVVKIYSEDNINLLWKELIHKGIMIIVNDYEYYKNAFLSFDCKSVQLSNLLTSAQSAVCNFIKLKTGKEVLNEKENTCLNIYLYGIFLYVIQWTLSGMPISVENLSAYLDESLPIPIKKYF